MKSHLLTMLGALLLSMPAHAGDVDFGPPYISTGSFLHPFGLAVDRANKRVIVADSGNEGWRWISLSAVTTSAGAYQDVGYVASRQGAGALTDPNACAVDVQGNVFVVNPLGGQVRLYNYSASGYTLDPTFDTAASRLVDSVAIHFPRDIAVDSTGTIYLLDSANKRILRAATRTASPWSTYRQDPSWNNSYGMAVDSSGTIYLADTGNSRILKITASTTTVIGHWGTGLAQFRFPRGIALDSAGRIYVADTDNHRIQVLKPDGTFLTQTGHAPFIGTLEKIAIDASDRVYAVDSDNNRVLVFLGADQAPPYDVYLRDFVGDPGADLLPTGHLIDSPDILVRHQPDINLSSAAASGLESYVFEPPYSGQTNYVYVAVHNHGPQPAADTYANVYFYDPYDTTGYPTAWKIDGFYQSYNDATHNVPSASLVVPLISAGGTVVVGPLLWRPPSPSSTIMQDGKVKLAVRLVNPFDSAPTTASSATVRASNNVSERPVTIGQGAFPVGTQNTLVVLVNYPDISSTTVAATVTTRTAEMAAWIKEASYGETIITLKQRGPQTLPQSSNYYLSQSNNPLVEMTQDALTPLLAQEPTVLDGAGAGQNVTRIILVTNNLSDTRDWATTNSWPYTFQGKTRYLTVSVQGGNNPTALFSHGMLHQLGLSDLYAYPNVTFPRPYADGWDTMAQPINGAHPLTWSKEHAEWVSAHGANILFVPRPAPGTTWNNNGQDIPLDFQETASTGQIVGIALGLTNTQTAFADETAFYYVEARKRVGADQVIASTGVLVYYANSFIPQGQGPVILRDHVPGGTLQDAAFSVGDQDQPNGTGITVQVKSPNAGHSGYNIGLSYAPPATDYDVFMQPGDPDYMSPDIWIDDQTDGYDEDNNRMPSDRGNTGVAGEENRVYARITNHGPATAYDVEVAFQLSQPWHTVGGADAFDEYKSVFIDQLAAGQSVTKYVTWTPATGVDPHTCVRVQLRRLFNDTNSGNDHAQRNFQIDHSAHGSPYTPVDFPFQVRNSTAAEQLMYFRADGIPTDWTWSMTPPKALVAAGATQSGLLHMQPPITAPDCTSHTIEVTGWIPRGDTLVKLGGATVQVDMQRKTNVGLTLTQAGCPGTGGAIYSSHANVPLKTCVELAAGGCTHPSQPNQDIVLRYQNGNDPPIYHTVHTDANGCYEDFYPTTSGGSWSVSVVTPGDQCLAPATATATATVALPVKPAVDDPTPNREHSLCLLSLSQNLQGKLSESAASEATDNACPAGARSASLALQTSGDFAIGAGTLSITGVQELLAAATPYESGLHHAHFFWQAGTFRALGQVSGVMGLGTHHDPLKSAESSNQPDHWELALDGVVTTGPLTGERLRASVALDVKGVSTVGTVEAILERDGLLTQTQITARVNQAAKDLKASLPGTCPTGVPCIARLSKFGKGEFLLDQTGVSYCADHRKSAKEWNRWKVNLSGNTKVEGKKPAFPDGAASADSFFQVTQDDVNGRGEHSATFIMTAKDGSRLEGTLLGLTRAGTHRDPLKENVEVFNEANHLEGRMTGTITSGPQMGSTVEARYVMQLNAVNGRHQTFVMTLEGWVVSPCATATPPVVTPITPVTPATVVSPVIPRVPVTRPPNIPVVLKPVTSEPDYVLEQFQSLDQAKAGHLTQDQFTQLIAPKGMKVPEKLNVEKARPLPGGPIPWKTLSELDTNHDGKLSPEESKGLPALMAREMFKRMDTNHDGVIDLNEYRAYAKTLPIVSLSGEKK